MAFMKFYVGNEANASSHRDGIYIAIDTKKIFYNGDAYGGGEVKNIGNTSLITGEYSDIKGIKDFYSNVFYIHRTNYDDSEVFDISLANGQVTFSLNNGKGSNTKAYISIYHPSDSSVPGNYYYYFGLGNGGQISISYLGIKFPGKTTSDLLNAGGSTTSVSNLVSQVTAAIVDGAPTTLDTLNELAAALGDDPNFATTITKQIAGKANASHTHKISEITDLQSTLDGKAASSHTHTIANISNLGSNWATALTAAKPNWITSVNIATISDLNANWDALLKSDPSSYVTRWPNISEVGSKQNLVIKLNGGTTEGTNQFTYNVTAAKSINITPSSIGAAASSHTHTASQVSGLSTVATSGSYNDLTNKPTIPSAYTLPTASNSTKGGVKIGSGLSMSGEVLSVSISNATTSSSGLMSSSDKSKLNGLPSSVEAMTSSEILNILNA